MLGLRVGTRCPAASSGKDATAAQSIKKIDLNIASPFQRAICFDYFALSNIAPSSFAAVVTNISPDPAAQRALTTS
jgi:hypothetical protein